MTKLLRIPLTWGAPIIHPATGKHDDKFPRFTERRVHLEPEHFDCFLAVSEALAKLLAAPAHIPPRLVGAPAYVAVLDPPPKKLLPAFVMIDEADRYTFRFTNRTLLGRIASASDELCFPSSILPTIKP